MTESQLLFQCIEEYESRISSGLKAISDHYDLSVLPYVAKCKKLIPSSGELTSIEYGLFKYHFHGIGCEFNYSGIIVDFDFTWRYFVYKGFTLFKLRQFILSHEEYKILSDEVLLSSLLTELVENGTLFERDKSDKLNEYLYQYYR